MRRNRSIHSDAVTPSPRLPGLKLARLDRIPRYVAIHEAGHATVSWISQKRLGFDWAPFDRIIVRTPREILSGPYIDRREREVNCMGIVERSDRFNAYGMGPANNPSLPDGVASLWRANMEADVIDTLAGPIAEAKFLHVSVLSSFLVGGEEDLRIAKHKAREFVRSENELRSLMASLQKEAAVLVRRPSVWEAINALADVVLRERTVEADEAVTTIRGVLQQDGELTKTTAEAATANRQLRSAARMTSSSSEVTA